MNNNIFIRDSKALEQKITKIKKDGVNQFHVISDFDRTLTPAFIQGKKPTTSFAQIREGGYLPNEYFEQAQALFHHYRPIEISDTMPLAEKKNHMKYWWEAHLSLIVKYGLTKSVIEDIINKRKIQFRPGAHEFISLLATHNIPILILSAGIGDIIKEFLRSEEALHPNLHIISNFFEFDGKGKAIKYISPITHTFNKNEGQIKQSPYHQQIEDRKNVLLLGDAFGDSSMLDGVNHETIIKIGFLNEDVERLKEKFSEEYDVLILNDGSMDYVNKLLKEIIEA